MHVKLLTLSGVPGGRYRVRALSQFSEHLSSSFLLYSNQLFDCKDPAVLGRYNATSSCQTVGWFLASEL